MLLSQVKMFSEKSFNSGIDLLAEVIKKICTHNQDVEFVVGGDGPKRLLLEETREKYQLHDRLTLLGEVPHTKYVVYRLF